MDLEKLLKEFMPIPEGGQLATSFSTTYTSIPITHFEEGKSIHAHLLVSGDTKAFLSKAKLDDPGLALIGLIRAPSLGIIKQDTQTVCLTVLSPNPTDVQSTNHLLDDVIQNDRRLTTRNLVKWIQQLFTTLFGIHRNYVVFSELTIQDVLLCAESQFISQFIKWLKPKCHPASKIDDSRQAWLHPTTMKRMTVLNELRKCDRLLTGSCSSKMDKESVFQSDLYHQCSTYCQSVQSNLRDLGLIILQMINRRIFTREEYNQWKRWRVATSNSKNILGSESGDEVGHHKKDTENAVAKQQIADAKHQLLIDVPILKSFHPVIGDILALCFASLTNPTVERQESRKGLAVVSIKYAAWKSYKALVSSLEDIVAELIDSGKYVKEDIWTAEDEKQRLKEHQFNKKRLKLKAVEGVKAAAARIKASNQEIWWSMQTEDFRTRMTRKKRNQKRYYSNRKKEQQLIKVAGFHNWNGHDLQRWIELSISEYMLMVIENHQKIEEMKPKKPEIFITQMIGDVMKAFDDAILSKIIARFSHGFNDLLRERAKDCSDDASDGSTASLSLTSLSKLDSVNYVVTSIYGKTIPKALMEISTGIELRKEIETARKIERDQLEGRMDELLIISNEQLRYKRLSIQAKHMSTQFHHLRKETLSFTRGIDILDREFSRSLSYVIAFSMLLKFYNEEAFRFQGENIAASRLQSFFRMIKTKNDYKNRIFDRKSLRHRHVDFHHHHNPHPSPVHSHQPPADVPSAPSFLLNKIDIPDDDQHHHVMQKSVSEPNLVVAKRKKPADVSVELKGRDSLPPTFEIVSYQIKAESIMFSCKVVLKSASFTELWLNSTSMVTVQRSEFDTEMQDMNIILKDTSIDYPESITPTAACKLTFLPQQMARVLLFSIRIMKLSPSQKYCIYFALDRSLEQSLAISYAKAKEGIFSECNLRWNCPQSIMGIDYNIQMRGRHLLQISMPVVTLARIPPPTVTNKLITCDINCKSTNRHVPWSIVESVEGQRLPLYFLGANQQQICSKCQFIVHCSCDVDFGETFNKGTCVAKRRLVVLSAKDQSEVGGSSWESVAVQLCQTLSGEVNNAKKLKEKMVGNVQDVIPAKEVMNVCKEYMYPFISANYLELIGMSGSEESVLVDSWMEAFYEYHFTTSNGFGISNESLKLPVAHIFINQSDLREIGKFHHSKNAELVGKIFDSNRILRKSSNQVFSEEKQSGISTNQINKTSLDDNNSINWLDSLEFASPLLNS